MDDKDIKIILVKVDSQYKVIETKLGSIDNHLKRINGSVGKHEEQIQEALPERARNRQEQRERVKDLDEMIPKVRALEDQQLSTKSVKKWIATSVALTGTVLGLFYTIYQILQNAGG